MFKFTTFGRRVAAALLGGLVMASSAGAQSCCDPWDNGPYDGAGAQTSQVGFDLDWRVFGRVSFDDFWLCEGNVYRIDRLRGTMLTDSIVPKALVVLLRDCDGRPDFSEDGVIAVANAQPIDTTNLPPGAECFVGSVDIIETGGTSDGFRIINVEANFGSLWIEGGAYWVTFVGYSGTADPLEQFFWGYAGNGIIKGAPGRFVDFIEQTDQDTSDLCCGCTDYAFCVEGETCKILLDNGGPDLAHVAPSFANPGSTFRDARAADDIVVANCRDLPVCFVEGYLLTNCLNPRARLDVYDNACKLPATFSPPITFEANCIIDTGVEIPVEGRLMRLYKVRFWDLRDTIGGPFVLQQNKNYWFSIYAVGSGSQTERGYFVGADRCDLRCKGLTRHFNPATVSGPGAGLFNNQWVSVADWADGDGTAFDLSLLVAVHNDRRIPLPVAVDPEPTPNPCPADVNESGDITVQDLFDFLAAYFNGCP